ncbi:CotS family spore coat protein [Clostridium sp.]|uniref:CotS family spore coat protein n=1 Tax=Clostridium sp. TaxID=1506 RepID=UPI003F2DF7AD
MKVNSIENTNEFMSISDLQSLILSNYNLKNAKIIPIKFKDTDKQRAVYKVESSEGTFCLKKVYYNEKSLLYVYSAMEWLSRNNLDVPKLLPTTTNNRYTNYSDMLFILTPWIEGEKCNFDNIDHVRLSSKNLAKLHKVSKNFFPIKGSEQRQGLADYNSSVNKHFTQLLNAINNGHRYDDDFSKIFLNSLDENLQLAKLSLEISSSINNENLSRSLCHGDYVNKNILIKSDDTISLIDFDKCKYDYCAHDISYFLRRYLKREGTNWDTELTLDMLNNYMSISELTPDDLKYILAYLAFPQKYWKLSRDYYKNIRKCNKNSFVNLLQKGLDRTSNQLTFVYEMINIFEKQYNITF